MNVEIDDKRPKGAPEVERRVLRDALAWMRAHLFNTWYNSILTVLVVYLLVTVVPPLVQWGVTGAVFGAAEPETCKAASGACWSIIVEKYRLILFGTYTYAEQWRPLVAMGLFIGVILASAYKPFWSVKLVYAWVAVFVTMGILMWGGVFGMPHVENRLWGGLVLTLLLAVIGALVAFPFSVLLALGRRSRLPIIRTFCVTFIELIRGVPLITLLFMSSVMFPLFLPEGMTIDNVLRAQVAIIMFVSAYLAEVVRGGLQALPKGQYEAAHALGLAYWQTMGLIILPQALKISIPPIVNTLIGMFKDTSLVVIIGLFDLMFATRAALSDAPWRPYFIEAYLFTAGIYFLFCFSMSRYSHWLERDLHRNTTY